MLKKLGVVGFSLFFLSGCTIKLPIPGLATGTQQGSVFKSTDAGDTFEPKVEVDEKVKLTSADILSFVHHPTDSNVLYIGTKDSGLFRTTDGAEDWDQIEFPPAKIYGLAIDSTNGDHLFASGSYGKIGKIYQTSDAGEEWKEVYTEPGEDTVITSLALHPVDTQVLYAGTSAGVVIKSTDGGGTWKNVIDAKAPVTQILFDPRARQTVFLVVFNKGTMVSFDGGLTFQDYTSQSIPKSYTDIKEKPVYPEDITYVTSDPLRSGVYYAGAKNGLFRTNDHGKSWQAIDIIESSKKFPIRAIAVNPANSNEIIYTSGNAFYKSIDGGLKWATTQLNVDRGVSALVYDPENPSTIYFTLRKY